MACQNIQITEIVESSDEEDVIVIPPAELILDDNDEGK